MSIIVEKKKNEIILSHNVYKLMVLIEDLFKDNIVHLDNSDEEGYISAVYNNVKMKYRELLDDYDIHINFGPTEFINIKQFPILAGLKPFIYHNIYEDVNLNYKTLKKYEGAVTDQDSFPHMINSDIWFISSTDKHKNKTFAYLTNDNEIIHFPVNNVKHVLVPKNSMDYNFGAIVNFRILSTSDTRIYEDVAVVIIPAISTNKLSKKSTYNICANYGTESFRHWQVNKYINNIKLLN